MNQHFIYNTLNQIQYFINKGEKEASLAYISKLSRLLRQWMYDAEQPYVSIADEIALLESYLALEQMRFADRFSFEVATGVPERETIFIVPHIIFPLVEHAVGWCLKHHDAGAISIYISHDAPFIHCSVQARCNTESLIANIHLIPQQNKQPPPCNVSSL